MYNTTLLYSCVFSNINGPSARLRRIRKMWSRFFCDNFFFNFHAVCARRTLRSRATAFFFISRHIAGSEFSQPQSSMCIRNSLRVKKDTLAFAERRAVYKIWEKVSDRPRRYETAHGGDTQRSRCVSERKRDVYAG